LRGGAGESTACTGVETRVAIAIGLGRQVTFWIAACVAIVLVMWLLREILLPFVSGMALAYLFNPLANRLERLGVGRLVASLAIIGLFVLSFVVLILLIVPVLGGQLAAFIENLPAYVRKLQAVVVDPSRPWLQSVMGDKAANTDASFGDLVTQGAGWLAAFMKSLWSGGQALISIFSLIVVTPVVAFYLLYDWDRMIATVDGWVPLPHRATVRQLAYEIDRAIAGFVRGQTGVCLILGSFYALGLTLVGLNFGLLIGLVAGLITFIPYVGSMTGLVLAAGVAVAQFWPDWGAILLVVAIFFAGQFIEGYILQPKLVGESVGLHPVWLMFALFAFGYLFGFVGMLLAVPLAAAIGVIVRFALAHYLKSPLYTGEDDLPAQDRTPRTSKKAG
jgi:predicted PurR-regulated permease PerM